jgi:hypothetical protein
VSLPPTTYSEWVTLLERFSEGDDGCLEPMGRGSISWANVVAERWTAQLTQTFTSRLKQIQNQLQRSLDRAAGDTFATSRALLDARRALSPLRILATLPCLEERLHTFLTGELDRWARETQQSLEKSARNVRHDNGRLLKAIRDTALTSAPGPTSTELHPTETLDSHPRSRRIIL